MAVNTPTEVVRKKTAEKVIYYYIDKEKGIDQVSREVYEKKNIEIHYPRGFDGGDKYKNIKKFIYIGFGGRLPQGVTSRVAKGWGFTKTLSGIGQYLDNVCEITEIHIEKGGPVKLDLDNYILHINETALARLVKRFNGIFTKHRSEISTNVVVTMHQLFPKEIDEPELKYVKNTLASSLALWSNDVDDFSGNDKDAIKDLFAKLSLTSDFLEGTALAHTKEIIDNKYIQSTLQEYEDFMDQKTETDVLEKKWQEFLQKHSWIFSYVLAQPIIVHQREAYVGGKDISGKGGNFIDFLIKNTLTDNLSFVEIKTHKTQLVEKNAYRGDEVFSVTKDLTGCIAQVLKQRDEFQKMFYAAQNKSKKVGNMETFNSRCVIIIGKVSDLTEEQRQSFELFRSNSRDVDIVTFDELYLKIKALQALVTNETDPSGEITTPKATAKPKVAEPKEAVSSKRVAAEKAEVGTKVKVKAKAKKASK